jgi:catechol 2,3-dioxygenase
MFNSLIAHLAHVEVITPKPQESLTFYRDVLGLEESGSDANSVYLRGWGEQHFHSLQLTEGPEPALGHAGWRASSADALEEAVGRLEGLGVGLGWLDPTTGHGRAYRFRGPSGHVQELFWDIDPYVPPADLEPIVSGRVQRVAPRGASARSIDHVTVNSFGPFDEAQWYRDALGLRFMEYLVLDHDPSVSVGAFLTAHTNSHELGLILDFSGVHTEPRVEGRCNHIAYWLDSHADVMRAADVFIDAGLSIEYGPSRHGVGENFFLYAREPGGMRVELFSGGYLNAVPDWEPVRHLASRGLSSWTPEQRPPEAFLLDAFPPLPAVAQAATS